MDNDELASLFAAKKEIEELKEQIKQLEKLKTMHEKQVGDLYAKNKAMAVFISDLGRWPKFWARTYKKLILQFIKDSGLWSGNND